MVLDIDGAVRMYRPDFHSVLLLCGYHCRYRGQEGFESDGISVDLGGRPSLKKKKCAFSHAVFPHQRDASRLRATKRCGMRYQTGKKSRVLVQKLEHVD